MLLDNCTKIQDSRKRLFSIVDWFPNVFINLFNAFLIFHNKYRMSRFLAQLLIMAGKVLVSKLLLVG